VADELFYARGLRAVGVDEIVARSAAAKASLYAHFPTKDDLICGYLRQRSVDWRAHLHSELARRGGTPRRQLDHVFDVLAEGCAAPGFRGCPFINAAVEFPDPAHPARVIAAEHRRWVRELLLRLAREARLRAPEMLAGQLALIYDAAMVGTQLDGETTPAESARDAARALVDAAAGVRRQRRVRPRSASRKRRAQN
jgi:AcrR family transcriptional regulator